MNRAMIQRAHVVSGDAYDLDLKHHHHHRFGVWPREHRRLPASCECVSAKQFTKPYVPSIFPNAFTTQLPNYSLASLVQNEPKDYLQYAFRALLVRQISCLLSSKSTTSQTIECDEMCQRPNSVTPVLAASQAKMALPEAHGIITSGNLDSLGT
jgi:hypothetical protein